MVAAHECRRYMQLLYNMRAERHVAKQTHQFIYDIAGPPHLQQPPYFRRVGFRGSQPSHERVQGGVYVTSAECKRQSTHVVNCSELKDTGFIMQALTQTSLSASPDILAAAASVVQHLGEISMIEVTA